MQSVEESLDATDRFLQTFVQNESRLDDPGYADYLRKLRQKHKRAMSITENWATSSSDSNCSAFCACCDCEPISKYRFQSENSLNQDYNDWQEEQTVQFTEEWIPDTPIPKPYHIIIREENLLRPATYSQKCIKEYLEEKERKQQEDEIKLKENQFKASEVPRSTYGPKYEEIQAEFEKARELRHQKAVEEAQSRKRRGLPGSRSGYLRRNIHLRRCLSAEASEWGKQKTFKAHAVPLTVYIPPFDAKLNAEIRARSKSERAINLMNNSRLPSNMQEHMIRSHMQHNLRHSKTCNNFSPTHQPKITKKVPNFRAIHKKLFEGLENAKIRRNTTVEPFHFETESRIHSRHHCALETPPKMTYRNKSPVRNARGKCVRLNLAALMRNEAIRTELKRSEEAKQNEKKFYDVSSESNQISRIRKELQERDAQYRYELEQINRRLRNRALIIEQQEMLIEKQKFEKKYAEKMNYILNRSKKLVPNIKRGISKESFSLNSSQHELNKSPFAPKDQASDSNISNDEEGSCYSESGLNSSNDKLSKISERTEVSSSSRMSH